MRRFLIIIGLILVASATLFLNFAVFDVSRDGLVEKYAKAPSQFLTLKDGLRVHYRDQGNRKKPVLLALHGSNANLFTWEPWVRELKNDYRIITVDLPTHGLTDNALNDDFSHEMYDRFLVEFTKELDLPRFTLIGSSMGGRYAWHYALNHPDQINNLVLVSASGVPTNKANESRSLVYVLMDIPLVNRLLEYALPESFISDALRAAFADDTLVTEEHVTLYHDLARLEGRRRANLKRMTAPREPSPVDRLGEISAPTLLIWGREDSFVPIEAGEYFDAHIPNSILVAYAGIGHVPMEELPVRSANDLRAFLTRNLK